jgi:malonate-semialdehyde dehydrogenase (acetylating)/methylmalonate-semialdehyde dehydrogenase
MDFIDGLFEESKTDKWNNLNDPSTQPLLSRVPETTEKLDRAVVSAKKAFESWRRTSILTRQSLRWSEVMAWSREGVERAMNLHRLQRLFREHADGLAASIMIEQGKTIGGVSSLSFVAVVSDTDEFCLFRYPRRRPVWAPSR